MTNCPFCGHIMPCPIHPTYRGPDPSNLFGGGARDTDPDTSWQAAYRDLMRRAGDRILALEAHFTHPRGLTDFELGDLIGRQQTSAGKRRGELRDILLIEATALRRPAPSGSLAIVWTITELGKRCHVELHRRRALP